MPWDTYTLKESTVRALATEIILRRLMVSDGNCHITVRAVGRNIAREIAQCPNTNFPVWIYTVVDNKLQDFGGHVWGAAGRRGVTASTVEIPISRRIYAFTR